MLLGPPGSGKGTLAELLEERLAIAHVSTGELFRREVERGTGLGRRVSRYVLEGQLVPDDVVVAVMTRELQRRSLTRGVVLDGFPRTVGQAQGLDRLLMRRKQPLDGALYLTCRPSVLVARLSGRRVCSRCGANYHVQTMPSTRQGFCDRCGGRLVIRKDDRVATIKQRLVIDRAKARPLVAYYRRKGLLHRLDGNGSIDKVFQQALRLFGRQGWLEDDRVKNS